MLPIKMNLTINFPMIFYYKIKYKIKITNNNFNKKISQIVYNQILAKQKKQKPLNLLTKMKIFLQYNEVIVYMINK